jgi:ribosomal protein L5
VVVLKKSAMHLFYVRMKTLFSPNKIQLWKDLRLTKSISFHLKNPLIFPELENQFQFFKTIPRLDITLITTSNSQKELFFLLKSIKFFL